MQTLNDLRIYPGDPFPFGATETNEGINFAIAAKSVKKLSLCLFTEDNQETPFAEIELNPLVNKMGDVWHIALSGLPPIFVYSFHCILPSSESTTYPLLDPYAKLVASTHIWENSPLLTYRPKAKYAKKENFDWQGDQFPNIPRKDLIIYEVHVRGFTKDSSSTVTHPGTFLGLIEKIPYLKDLGVNAIELLPVHEFNESEAPYINPLTHQKLCNYFGYSTINFCSLMNRYASSSSEQQVIVEFKTMVREFHKNGIEVILDVVYNHTGEGGQQGPTLSFRGLNPPAYYMIDAQGHYLNFSGCGNTLNTNHPLTRELILHSLRYWVTETHVDGFRFDLASILTRAENGTPLHHSAIVEAISQDPILSQTKLIAEAWDAGGLYQVGGFYPGTRWSEWNGRYRDVIRRFIKGTSGYKTSFATALCGSQDLYGWRGSPTCSINFVTSHDGFSLNDLVSYNEKHNLENGENNLDGFNHNDSWNCGVEGPSTIKKIVDLRERQMRNFHLALMISQGIPMITMGDEYGHTRQGNNNPWCQDNELNWFLWNDLLLKKEFFRYYRALIQFRKTHPELGKNAFLQEKDISWHGIIPFKPDWEIDNRLIAFTLNSNKEQSLYVAFNSGDSEQTIELPSPGKGKAWRWVVNTANSSPNDYYEDSQRKKVSENVYKMQPYSALMLGRVVNS